MTIAMNCAHIILGTMEDDHDQRQEAIESIAALKRIDEAMAGLERSVTGAVGFELSRSGHKN